MHLLDDFYCTEKKDGKVVYSKLIYNGILMAVIAALSKH